MMHEIERKFLVNKDIKIERLNTPIKITQGYLSSVPERTVRVRIIGDKGFLTIKGIGNESGTSRFELEKELDLNEARSLLNICEPGVIEKTRAHVKVGNHKFEIDKFSGDNEGLIIAEIELSDENESFEKPEWLGSEVTGNNKYYNSMLIKNPYKNWK